MEQPVSQSEEAVFPNAAIKPGAVHVMDTQFDQRIIVMSEQDWGRFGTQVESMRQMLKNQDDRIKQLLGEVALAKDAAADAATRLDNIRHIRRNEMRARIEGEVEDLVLPGDRKFSLDLTKRK